jgi:PKD repeat protein
MPVAAIAMNCDEMVCRFDGWDSEDPDGTIAEYLWEFGDGASDEGGFVQHAYADSGSFLVRLTVVDDRGGTAEQTRLVEVEAPNAPPNAHFFVSCTYTECLLDAGSSSDPEGELTDFEWTLGDGNSANGKTVEHTYAEAGSYTIELTVTDAGGISDSRRSSISVNLPNEAPRAAFGVSCEALDCRFDASASHDPDGDVTAWHWSFGDGHAAEGATAQHTFSGSGQYEVTLTVADNDGEQDSMSLLVAVEAAQEPPESQDPFGPAPNEEPEALFEFECENLLCRFDASASSDPDGEVTTYQWDFDDGTTARGAIVEHRFDAAGRYSVHLTVTDDDGDSDKRWRTVRATEPEPESEPEPIRLKVRTKSLGETRMTTLNWVNARTDYVDILVDGKRSARVANTGVHVLPAARDKRQASEFQVCESESQFCSALASPVLQR